MQITRAADYAVRVMIHLASLAPGTRASRSELAAAADCPDQFLSKVLQQLTRAGLVISHRGNTGGFQLPPNGTSATVLNVIEAIEGPIQLNLCLTNRQACDRQSWCPAHSVWEQAQRAMVDVLDSASITDLAKAAAGRKSPPPDGLVEGPDWN